MYTFNSKGNFERPARLDVSARKLKEHYPVETGRYLGRSGDFPAEFKNALEGVREIMWEGTLLASVVISVRPLLISTYEPTMDTSIVYGFEDWRVCEYSLQEGSRLCSAAMYFQFGDADPATDIVHNPRSGSRAADLASVVAHFVCEQESEVEAAMRKLGDGEFQLAYEIGKRFHQLNPGIYRSGAWRGTESVLPLVELNRFEIPEHPFLQPAWNEPRLPATPPVAVNLQVTLDLPQKARVVSVPPEYVPE